MKETSYTSSKKLANYCIALFEMDSKRTFPKEGLKTISISKITEILKDIYPLQIMEKIIKLNKLPNVLLRKTFLNIKICFAVRQIPTYYI